MIKMHFITLTKLSLSEMVTLFLLLWGMVSARIKSTNLDYRMVQQLDGLKRLVKLNEGVVATCNLVLIPQPVNYRYHLLHIHKHNS